ncbi:MAG TPA: LLM class flavin-dependent oxidoreductase [Candidatus Binataceae bacterium]|nr:LLM class flavin-dependent oxidoreductase [Candidatus Binataceae bacterium]
MHIMTFSERPYFHVPEDDIINNGSSYFGIPNTNLDPVKGGQLYNEYFDERVYAEELGFDGVMLNEHHQTPFCLGAVMDVEAAILARITKKVKIVLLGNPLPVADPLRLAEELAMIDMISGGRLVPGWVRGAGSEQIANNISPAYNRERFNEAHDFIIKAWTTPGPWRYEGKHYHYRFVNPWQLPIQKPHPPIWIPGLISPETVVWCAEHRYPYVALCTNLEPTIEMSNLYADTAARMGYQAGPENFGYLQNVFVAETEERASELAHGFVYGGGFGSFARAEWMFPPGYNSKEATRRLAKQFTDPRTGAEILHFTPGEVDVQKIKANIEKNYQSSRDLGLIIAGTPKTVINRLRYLLETLRPGILAFWYHHGPMSAQDRRTCLRLLGEEVVPAVREIAKELDLPGPFEQKPGIRPLPASGKRDAVVNYQPSAAAGS